MECRFCPDVAQLAVLAKQLSYEDTKQLMEGLLGGQEATEDEIIVRMKTLK